MAGVAKLGGGQAARSRAGGRSVLQLVFVGFETLLFDGQLRLGLLQLGFQLVALFPGFFHPLPAGLDFRHRAFV